MKRAAVITLALVAIILACSTRKPPNREWGAVTEVIGEQESGTITGVVTDIVTSDPIRWVNVVVRGTGKGYVTKPDGSFIIMGIPPGDYSVITMAQNYERSQEDYVTVSPGDTTWITFELWPMYGYPPHPSDMD